MCLPAVNSNVTPIATIIKQMISPEAVAIINLDRRPISKQFFRISKIRFSISLLNFFD